MYGRWDNYCDEKREDEVKELEREEKMDHKKGKKKRDKGERA